MRVFPGLVLLALADGMHATSARLIARLDKPCSIAARGAMKEVVVSVTIPRTIQSRTASRGKFYGNRV
jgi:hypothetical protein